MVDYLGVVRDGTLDYSSPYFISSGAKGAYIVTDDGTDIRVYRCTDIEAAGLLDWTLVSSGTFTPGAGWKGKCRIISSREEQDFVLVAWKDQTGVKVARSTAGTPIFGSPVTVGSTVADTGHDNDELGVWVHEELQVIIAPDGTTDDGEYLYYPYAATDKAGSFTAVSNVPAGFRSILGCIMAPEETFFYAPMVNPVPPVINPLTPVTFDVGGYPNYTILGAGTTNAITGTNVAYNAVNTSGTGLTNGVLVEIVFEADYILTGITWLANQTGGTLNGKTYSIRVDCFDSEGTLVKRFDETNAFGFLQGVTNDDLQLSIPIRSVEITIKLDWVSDNGVGINNVYIDNITFEAIMIDQDTERKLYRVTLPSTWDDVTPNDPVMPNTPYGMAADPAATSNVSMLAKDENGYTRLLNTVSDGTSWSTRLRNCRYTGLKRGGDTLILWGYNTIELSPDKGFTFYRRMGNWSRAVGAVDEIRWVAGVL